MWHASTQSQLEQGSCEMISLKAVVQRCSVKNLFLENSQNSQLCQSLFVNKAVGLRPLVAASVCFSSLDNQERKLRMKYFGSLFGGVRHRFIINISIAWFPPMRLTCSHVYSYDNKYNLTCGNALNNLKKINLKIFHEIISLFS